ncbi:MAG: hypothetical protein ABI321_16310 [Polyangia bacterium]
MPISSKAVERVVEDISSGARDPNHVASLVGELMRAQPAVGHYVQGHARELTVEGTVVVLLHAAVIVRCVESSRRQMLRKLDFRVLDLAASQPGALALEPALGSYVDSNVTDEDALLGGPRRKTARAILDTIARAALADSI